MIKKQVQKSSADIRHQSKDSLPCSICKNVWSKKELHICESGHVVCKNCQNADGKESRQDSGDYISKDIVLPKAKIGFSSRNPRSEPVFEKNKVLASGDHDKGNNNQRSKSENKRRTKSASNVTHIEKMSVGRQDMETIVDYKNENYYDCQSSSSSSIINSKKNLSLEPNIPRPNNIFPRPVMCPVLDCGKMIAIDSVMLHFYFDHAKVPRLPLHGDDTQKVLLKASSLSMKTRCLAIFILHEKKESMEENLPIHLTTTINRAMIDHKPLLLMGLRMPTEALNVVDGKCDTKLLFTRDSCTQPNVTNFNTYAKDNTSISLNESNNFTNVSDDTFENNELMVLWMCKLDDNASTYCITVLREDRRQGHSFIGEAIHIREKQDAVAIQQKSECLIIRGVAANKLLDDQNQFSLVVNILK